MIYLKNLTEGNIYKNFILFAFPVVLSGVMSQAFGVINSAIAGTYLGELGRAATGCTAGFISFISSLLWGYCTGVGLKTAILFGARDSESLKKSFWSNISFVSLACIIISLLCVTFKNQIFTFLKVDPTVREQAELYYLIYVSTLILYIINVFFVKFFQALGVSAYPFKVSTVTTAFGIVLRILSIVMLGMGVEGIAIAAAVSALAANLLYFKKAFSCFRELGCESVKPEFDVHEIKSTFRLSMPSSLQQGVMYVATFLISPTVNALGKSATAAYSVALQTYEINAAIYQNSAITVSSYTAQCVGAKKYENLKKGVRVGFLQGIIFLVPVLLATVIFAKPLCSLFFEKGFVGESFDLALLFVRSFLPFVFFNVINNLFHNFFRGVKAVNLVLLFTALASVVRIISTLALAPVHGMIGVYTGWVISWIFEAVIISLAYFLGVWKKYLK